MKERAVNLEDLVEAKEKRDRELRETAAKLSHSSIEEINEEEESNAKSSKE